MRIRDCFDIILENGSKKKMEVVTIFDIDGYDYHYIIYCELDRSNYYLAKYIGDEIVNLRNDFDDNEYKIANGIFRGVINE